MNKQTMLRDLHCLVLKHTENVHGNVVNFFSANSSPLHQLSMHFIEKIVVNWNWMTVKMLSPQSLKKKSLKIFARKIEVLR